MGNPKMRWDRDFETGIPEIDRQHKAIIDYTVEYRDVLENGSGRETYEGFLEYLDTYVRIHFAYEENCMFVHKCPIAGRNKKEHAAFIRIVEKEIAEFAKVGYDEARVVSLLDVIDVWLMSHIGRIDVQLKDSIK